MLTLSPTQKTQLADIAERYQVTLLYMFGSVARGDQTKDSDCDLGYAAATKLSLQQQFALQTDLQSILPVTQAIDLVNLVNATPLLAYQIVREGQVLFAQPNVEDNFYQRTIKNYIDTRPLFQATQQYVQAYANR